MGDLSLAMDRDLVPRPAPSAGESPLRIALFSGNYNCVRDGANQALNRLVGFLTDEIGARVRVYSPTVAKPAFPPTGDLVSVPSIGIPGRTEYRLALGLPAAIRADIERFDPDVVHLSAPDILGRRAQLFAKQRGIPVVTSLHTRFETYFQYYGLGFLRRAAERYLRRFYGDSDWVLVPNRLIAQEMRASGARIAIWGRGVDRTIFSAEQRDLAWRRSLGYDDEDTVILFFGRIVREKGIEMFARVIAKSRARGHDLRPLVIGDGPGRGDFARQLPNANFIGHLEGPELGRAVASADILLNPSVTEAFGNVTLEAMAAGVAILSADVPSARALVEHKRSGLLVPPGKVDAYVEGLDRLIRNPARRRSLSSAASEAAGRYEWKEVLSDVASVYRHCVKV